MEWFHIDYSKKTAVSGPPIKYRAVEIAVKYEMKDLYASSCRIGRFTNRLTLCKRKCVESDVDENVVNECNKKFLSVIGEYSASNIYNSHESELFYNL